jgi:hypothetical protein
VIIDAFGTIQDVAIGNGGANPSTNGSGVTAPDAIGGARYVSLTRQTSVNGADVFVNAGSVAFSTNANVTASSTFTWDGSTASALNPTGLGGVDLTSAGSNIQMSLGLQADQPGGLITIIIYTDATHVSQATVTTVGGPTFDISNILFSNFVSTGSSGGADFTNVGAVQLFIDDVSQGTPLSLDAQVNFLAATAAPEPSSIALLSIGTGLLFIARRKRKA